MMYSEKDFKKVFRLRDGSFVGQGNHVKIVRKMIRSQKQMKVDLNTEYMKINIPLGRPNENLIGEIGRIKDIISDKTAWVQFLFRFPNNVIVIGDYVIYRDEIKRANMDEIHEFDIKAELLDAERVARKL